ncbi:hypothetical protein PCYB_002720 [Plasmodium cynomolgi strain B]|uniref:CYIR protein n=1 Tax=Plasmodium cynomolgi (strain B) TaxID=1120755 RepID=K6UNI3_PLACD|nr:hypothetical protein PCYB_002720 [Plasmodium cynomolgi strain B]GAB69523.1 hypothetical protein PCYB_002720 [Plasmodium cynomolgi strain B]
MSEIGIDIEKWKSEYPFFNHVWKMYEDFEKNVSDDDKDHYFYETTCKVIFGRNNDYIIKYNKYCMKLLRNLGVYSDDPSIYKPNSERCKNLYNWLHYMIMKHNIPDDIIIKIFQKAKDLTSNNPMMEICDYNYNKNIKKAENIIKLLNLQYNINIVEGILAGEKINDYCLCEKYINECVNIYKSIKNMYCSEPTDKQTNSETCSHVQSFESTYNNFLFYKQQFQDNIPSLTSSNNEYVGKCEATKSSPVPISTERDSSANPKKISVTGALGTIAGVSSVLALLYKVN